MNDNSQITQIIIKKFADFINKQNFPDERKDQILLELSNTMATQFMLVVTKTFTDQDLKNWEDYLSNSPSTSEQWDTLEQFYKQKTNEDFTGLLNRLANNLVTNTISTTKEYTTLLQKISELPKEKKDLFEKYVKEENMTEANKILYGDK